MGGEHNVRCVRKCTLQGEMRNSRDAHRRAPNSRKPPCQLRTPTSIGRNSNSYKRPSWRWRVSAHIIYSCLKRRRVVGGGRDIGTSRHMAARIRTKHRAAKIDTPNSASDANADRRQTAFRRWPGILTRLKINYSIPRGAFFGKLLRRVRINASRGRAANRAPPAKLTVALDGARGPKTEEQGVNSRFYPVFPPNSGKASYSAYPS